MTIPPAPPGFIRIWQKSSPLYISVGVIAGVSVEPDDETTVIHLTVGTPSRIYVKVTLADLIDQIQYATAR